MLSCSTLGRLSLAESLALVVRFMLKEGAESAFDKLTAETLTAIRTLEPGTLVYATARVPDNPAIRVFFEVYRDRQAFDNHQAQTHTRRFLAEREQLLDRFEVTFLTVAGAKGIPGAT